MKNYFTGDWYSDLCMLECIVMDLEFYSGSERKYKCDGKHTKNMGSMLYGITWRQRASYQKQRELDSESGMYKTKIYEEEPELKAIFKEFSQLYFPEFDYLQIQMNKNFKILPHFDSKNAGISKFRLEITLVVTQELHMMITKWLIMIVEIALSRSTAPNINIGSNLFLERATHSFFFRTPTFSNALRREMLYWFRFFSFYG